jgi:hypothetical protein
MQKLFFTLPNQQAQEPINKDLHGVIFNVSSLTGQRQIVTNFGHTNQGPTKGVSPIGIVVWLNP